MRLCFPQQPLTSAHLAELGSMMVLINCPACCNVMSWSHANGQRGSVSAFISCRLTASTVEQKTSSGMHQMKEQIIPLPGWHVHQTLKVCLPRLPPSNTFGHVQNWQQCEHVCAFSGYLPLKQLGEICCEMMSDQCSNTNRRSGTQRARWLSVLWIHSSSSSRASETQAASSLSLCPAALGSGLQSVHVAPWCLSHLPGLKNRKSGASCVSLHNLKF